MPQELINATTTAKEALDIFNNLPPILQSDLMSRGANHGINPEELLQKVPKELLDNPIEIFKFIDSKHISHIVATSKGGSSSDFKNWIFEDGPVNMSRGNSEMSTSEFLRAQLDNKIDAASIEFGTPDPGTPGYKQAFEHAFGENQPFGVDLDALGLQETLKTATTTNFDPTLGTFTNSNMSEALQESLQSSFITETGIPVAYVVTKGMGGVLPFLRDINWKRFKNESQYRNRIVAHALRTFRKQGWKDLAKAAVIGFLISAFPPLAYFMAALGITGIAAVGTRWLSSKIRHLPGELGQTLGNILETISAALSTIALWLKKVLDKLEKIVEVVIETASKVTKRVIKAGASFVKSVANTAKSIVNSASKAACATAKAAKKAFTHATQSVMNWVFGWFSKPAIT